MIQVLADENVPLPVIEHLRTAGITVISIAHSNAGIDDPAVAAQARLHGVVLVTHDRDFGELVVRFGAPVLGVVLLQTERLSLELQAARVVACLTNPQEDWDGYFSVIEPGRIRRRPLTGGL